MRIEIVRDTYYFATQVQYIILNSRKRGCDKTGSLTEYTPRKPSLVPVGFVHG